MHVYLVMREVPYEGGSLVGVFSNRDSAIICAKEKCQERLGMSESSREPYYEKRDDDFEMYHDGYVEWWVMKEQVND